MTEPVTSPLQSLSGSAPRTEMAEAAMGKASGTTPDGSRLEEACEQLESLFIHQLFQQMRATVPKSGLLGGGSTEAIYTSMLDQQMSQDLASRGGIGLAALLRDQLAESEK